MKAIAFFSNTTGDIRLEVENNAPVHFESTSSLVNYCNEVGIHADWRMED